VQRTSEKTIYTRHECKIKFKLKLLKIEGFIPFNSPTTYLSPNKFTPIKLEEIANRKIISIIRCGIFYILLSEYPSKKTNSL